MRFGTRVSAPGLRQSDTSGLRAALTTALRATIARLGPWIAAARSTAPAREAAGAARYYTLVRPDGSAELRLRLPSGADLLIARR